MGRSKVASEVTRERMARFAAMSPEQRTDLAARLGEAAIDTYMATQGVDRRTAIHRIRVTRRLGRPRSAAAGQ